MRHRLVFGMVALLAGCGPIGGASPVAPAKPGETVFLATVTGVGIGNLRHPYLKWVVTLKVDEVVSGPWIGDVFWFAIHSPSQEGVEVGKRYRITVVKKGDGSFDLISRIRQN